MAKIVLPDWLFEDFKSKGYSLNEIRKLADYYYQNPHAWWRPTGNHEKYGGFLGYLEALDKANHKCRDIVFFGGNRIGKTAGMVNSILGLCLDKVYNPFLRGEGELNGVKGLGAKSFFVNFRRPNVGLVILPKRVAQKVFCPEMRKWAPKGSYRTRMGDSKFESEWEFKGEDGRFESGSRFSIFTIDQNVGQMEGETLDWIASDEKFPITLYNEGFSRFFEAMCVWMGFMTPLVAARWYVNRIYALPEDMRQIVVAHKESACKTHNIGGFRDHKAIEQDIRRVTPSEYAPRVEGKPQHTVGLIYKQFRPDGHNGNVLPIETIVEICRQKGCSLYCGCDPHESRYNAVVWLAVTPNGICYIVDEWPRWDPGVLHEPLGSDVLSPFVNPYDSYQNVKMEPAVFCATVQTIEKALCEKFAYRCTLPGGVSREIPTRIVGRYIDPRFSSRTGIGRSINLRSLYDQFGVHFDKAVAESDLMSSHNRIGQMFAGQFIDDTQVSGASLFVGNNCRNTIYQIQNYGYKMEAHRGGLTGEYSEVIDDSFKDFPDAVRYVLSRNPTFVQLAPQMPEHTRDARRQERYRNSGVFKGM